MYHQLGHVSLAGTRWPSWQFYWCLHLFGFYKMNKLEELAVELALLSNGDVQQLASIMVRDYTLRADVFETALSNSFFDNQQESTDD
jgi:hypothetical protein